MQIAYTLKFSMSILKMYVKKSLLHLKKNSLSVL